MAHLELLFDPTGQPQAVRVEDLSLTHLAEAAASIKQRHKVAHVGVPDDATPRVEVVFDGLNVTRIEASNASTPILEAASLLLEEMARHQIRQALVGSQAARQQILAPAKQLSVVR